jgi:hypothetical protein
MPPTETHATRFDRIEEKLDKLSEAMISLARAEEKLINIERTGHNHSIQMGLLETRIDKLERCAVEQQQTISNFAKLFWIVIVAMVGTLVGTVTHM